MRVHLIIGVVGFWGFWFLAGGCGQEASPPKPSAPVVKEVQKPAKPTVPRKPVAKKRDVARAKPSKTPKVKKTVEKASAKKEPSVPKARPTAPKKREQVAYAYIPGDRPDPFRPFFIEVKTSEPMPECLEMPIGPLTSQEALQFTIVAVVARGEEGFAMVEDATGKGYVLRSGTYVGKNCGRVTWIGHDGVIIEEPYRDLLGQRKTRRVTLEFKRSEGGGL